jgi:hypothetical protein
MKIKHAKPGELIWLESGKNHKLVCCSCGRTHFLRVTPAGAGVLLGLWDDEVGTKWERKKVLGLKE